MKLLILFLGFVAGVLSDELAERPDLHKLHYRQHQQNIEEAKRKIADVLDRHQSSFENTGSHSSSGFGRSSIDAYDNSQTKSFSSSSSTSSDTKCYHPCSISSMPKHTSSHTAKFIEGSDFSSSSSSFVPEYHRGSDLFHADTQKAVAIPVYPAPSSSSDIYSKYNERIERNRNVVPVVYTPAKTDSEKYMHHEERRTQSHSVPMVHYSTPIENSEKYSYREHHESLDQTLPSYQSAIPVHHYVAPSEREDSYMKYKKISSSVSEPLPLLTPASYSLSKHSSLDSSMKSGLSSSSLTNFNLDTPVRTSSLSNTYGKTDYSGTKSYESASSLDSRLSFDDKSNFVSKFDSNFDADSLLSGKRLLESSSSGLQNYIQEAERLAKAQAQGLSPGSSRVGGSHLPSSLDSFARLGDVSNFGNLNTGGYKTKSWEKSSKWSSQSQYDSDGMVKNYNELSTGESEQYDINGQRSGYKAATATVDDNGKVSSYSLHT